MITETITIIKKGDKFYIQRIEEEEISMSKLQGMLESVKAQKDQDVAELTDSFDKRIAILEDKIAQIKSLS